MNDKEWLDKLIIAKNAYGDNAEVDAFIKWVFKQYGMVYTGKT
jgi:hypothetical protein